MFIVGSFRILSKNKQETSYFGGMESEPSQARHCLSHGSLYSAVSLHSGSPTTAACSLYQAKHGTASPMVPSIPRSAHPPVDVSFFSLTFFRAGGVTGGGWGGAGILAAVRGKTVFG